MIDFITDHKDEFGVEPICRVLNEHGIKIAPSTFYEVRSRRPSKRQVRDAELVALIEAEKQRQKFIARFGARKMWLHLRGQGHDVARCTVERVFRQQGWQGALRRKRFTPPAESVDLGYAVTAHRAQGVTVDTAHVVVASTTRENLYVSMTRGRSDNTAYVTLDQPDDSHAPLEDSEISARTVLFGVLQHSGAELSAHQAVEAEHEHWSSIAQLAAEYDTIAAVAQRDRWIDLLRRAGLTDDQTTDLLDSGSFGPLAAELRRAEARHLNLQTALPQLVASRSLGDADDIGAVLISRIQRAVTRRSQRHRGDPERLIAGLIPIAAGPMAPGMAEALEQRRQLIEARAVALAQRAKAQEPRWLERLGTPPPESSPDHDAWLHELRTVAAYRDLHRVDSDTGLGNASSDAQLLDRARATQAIRRARAMADGDSRALSRLGSHSTAPSSAPVATVAR